ncbi:putative membrane protein (plasmid) [Pseudomonas syringae]|nr:putative membrane protein [Pseudomonas syringae]
MRSHLRFVVAVILTVIPLDHVVACHLLWIGYLERVLTSTMVYATSRIKHLVYELVITNDPHSVTAFRGYQVGSQPIVVQLIVVIEPRFYVDEIATVYHTRPAIAQIFDSAVTMQM